MDREKEESTLRKGVCKKQRGSECLIFGVGKTWSFEDGRLLV